MRSILLCLLVGLIVASPTLIVSCHPMETRVSIAQPTVAPEVATGFACARVALSLLDAAEAYHLDSLAHPTDAELKASSDRVAKLVAAREVLERVRQHLDGEVKPDLRQVLDDLALIATSAQGSGLKVPPEVISAILEARKVLP